MRRICEQSADAPICQLLTGVEIHLPQGLLEEDLLLEQERLFRYS